MKSDLCVRSQVANQTIAYDTKGLGEAAPIQTFNLKGKNVKITVANHFKEKHGVELKLVY